MDNIKINIRNKHPSPKKCIRVKKASIHWKLVTRLEKQRVHIYMYTLKQFKQVSLKI